MFNNVRFNISRTNLIIYLVGCLLFAVGVKLLMAADQGVDPYHAMVLGIVKQIGLPWVQVGVISGAITISVLLLWSLITRTRIPISPFITMVLVGGLVDVLGWFEAESLIPPFTSGQMVFGLLADAYASALIIASGFGIRVMDLVALSLARGPLRRFTISKLLLEISFVAIAYLTGGPIGVATLLFVLIVGILIEPLMLLNRTLFGLDLHRDMLREPLGSRRPALAFRARRGAAESAATGP